MKYPALVRHGAAVLAALATAGAMAQTTSDNQAPPDPPGQKLTDVGPLPAEDRDSAGAVVMEKKPVPGVRRSGLTEEVERATRAMGASPSPKRGPDTVDTDIVTPVEGGAGETVEQPPATKP